MSFKEKSPLVVALYLPQYYETEYNNKWWEKGYTEWVACKRAKPLYPGPVSYTHLDVYKRQPTAVGKRTAVRTRCWPWRICSTAWGSTITSP